MTIKYTNTIITARHRRLGPLRLIHQNLVPWLCLEDLARFLDTSPGQLSRLLCGVPEVLHIVGCRFIQMGKNSLPRKFKQPDLQRWINATLTHSGLKGPFHKFKASKSAHAASGDLTVRLDVLYKLCEDSLSYHEWKRDLLGQVQEAGERVAEVSLAIEADRIPQEDARITLICQAPTSNKERALWVALYEALKGWHTQTSLNQAVDLAEALIPDSFDTIDAAALHEFLQISDPFDVWLNEQIYWQELRPGKEYFIEGGLRFLPLGSTSTRIVSTRMSMACADAIISRVRTPRGASLRYLIEHEREYAEPAEV